jgi:hypothetical protein
MGTVGTGELLVLLTLLAAATLAVIVIALALVVTLSRRHEPARRPPDWREAPAGSAVAGQEDGRPAPPAEEGAVAAALVPAGPAGAAVAGVDVHGGEVQAPDLVPRAVRALEGAAVRHPRRG